MGKIRRKFKYLFTAGFLIIGIIGGVFLFAYNDYFYNTKIMNEISSNLIKVTEEKSEKINDYLEAIERDIKILQESDEIKEFLKEDLVVDESVIKMDVDERARIISKEIENYLRARPEMTLKKLQESSEFQEIAVQPVGSNGYSFLFDSQSLINYFHKEPRRIGYDYNTMEKTFPELWNMFKETSKKGFSEGFYYRDEPDGSTSYKYGKFVQIPVRTVDGVGMSVGTTAYVDDYKTIQKDSKYLKNFNKKKDYHNLVLISLEGYESYMVKIMGGFGTNLNWEINLKDGLSYNYFRVKEKQNIYFYGPYIGICGDINPKISVIAPVYESGELLGYVSLINEMDEIYEITEKITDISKTEEIYLVNMDGLLISSLKYSDLDIMVQSINTENVEECSKEGIIIADNYEGREILGSHKYIEKMGWCLLGEVDKNETINTPLRESTRRNLLILLPIVLILALIGFFTGDYFDKRYKEGKVREFPCGIKRKFQPWYCKLMGGDCVTYPKEKCGRVIKIRNFFANLKLGYLITVALILAIGYFFLINLFFDYIIYPLVTFGLLSLIISFFIFFQGFKLKYSRSKKYLFLGAGAIILYHLVHIPMEQYFNTVRPFNILYWTPTIILYILGFLFLLIFLRRSLK